MPFIFAVWVGRHIESRFVLHLGLVGLVAALIYMGLSWGQQQPLLYKIAHGSRCNVAIAEAAAVTAIERRIRIETADG